MMFILSLILMILKPNMLLPLYLISTMINYILAVVHPEDDIIMPLCWCKTLDDAVKAIRQKFGYPPYTCEYLIISYDHHDILNVNYDGQVLTLN